MSKTQIVKIGNNEFALPAGMSPAELRNLLGVLAQLRPVESFWLYGSSGEYLYALSDDFASVALGERRLIDREEARAQYTAARDAYEAARSKEQETER